jgi:hypothetical protein
MFAIKLIMHMNSKLDTQQKTSTLQQGFNHTDRKNFERMYVVYQRTPADISTYYRNAVAFEDSSLCSHTSNILWPFQRPGIRALLTRNGRCVLCAQMYAYSSWIAGFGLLTSCVVSPFSARTVTYLCCSFVYCVRHAVIKRDDRHLPVITMIKNAKWETAD